MIASDAPTAAASTMAGAARLDFSSATPVAKAAPDAARAELLPTMVAAALAAAMPPMPRQAALRAHLSPVSHSPIASPVHSMPWPASRPSLVGTRPGSRESFPAMRHAAA